MNESFCLAGILSFVPDAVVLANGDYPVHDYPLSLLNSVPYVVCCDGAGTSFMAHGRKPDAIVGDGDSFSNEYRELCAGILHRIPDQETNDLTKAISFLLRRGFRRVVILGATGKREDHTMGNIALLMEHAPSFEKLAMVTDFGVFLPCRETQVFTSIPHGQVSLFNFGAAHMRSEGLVYPIRAFSKWWEGTLNEASSSSFTVYADGDYMVYIAYEVKG